jgi:acylglycerol lipase
MPYEENRFETFDGLHLHERGWLPEGDPVGVVVVVHGIMEHSGRYAELAAELTGRGYAVWSFDLRGHGNSEGGRICIRSFDEYLKDLEWFLDRVRSRHPGEPPYLLGHSMGGNIAALFTLTRREELRGLVLSAPALRIGGAISPLLRHLAGLTSRVLPWLRIGRVTYHTLSRDPEVIDDFKTDPLVFHGRFPVRTGAEILRAARRIMDQAEAIELPLLVLHGTRDVVTTAEGSRQLHARAGSDDKTLKLYEGLYHDLFHEPEKDEVTADLIEWLAARSRAAGGESASG